MIVISSSEKTYPCIMHKKITLSFYAGHIQKIFIQLPGDDGQPGLWYMQSIIAVIVWGTQEPMLPSHSETLAKLLLSLGFRDRLCLTFSYMNLLKPLNGMAPCLR